MPEHAFTGSLPSGLKGTLWTSGMQQANPGGEPFGGGSSLLLLVTCLPPEAREECPIWFFLLVSDFYLDSLYLESLSLWLSLIVEAYDNSGWEVFDKSSFWVSAELMGICLIAVKIKTKITMKTVSEAASVAKWPSTCPACRRPWVQFHHQETATLECGV